MKKNITSLLLCVTFLHMSFAQGNSYAEIIQITTPFKFFRQGSSDGKNMYFQKNWVKASLLKSDNTVVRNDSALYNFDKIERKLLVTSDFKKIYEIDHREFKAIKFYSQDTSYIFKHINFINDKDLFQVLISHKDKYSLFKVVRTKVVKGSAGMFLVQSQNSAFDRYEDVTDYYIFFPNREYISFFVLKKEAIERVFKLLPEADRIAAFLNATGKEDFDEVDIVEMVNYLNS